jgi:hypothetical protein
MRLIFAGIGSGEVMGIQPEEVPVIQRHRKNRAIRDFFISFIISMT